MVNQHMDVQPTQPRRVPADTETSQQQQHPSVGTPPCLTNAQPAPLPFIQTSPADTRTKSKNGQGVKQSKSLAADKPDITCWRCKHLGTSNATVPCHHSASSADRKATFHISVLSRTKGTTHRLPKYRLRWTLTSRTLGTNASTVGVNMNLHYAQQGPSNRQPQTVQVGHHKQALPVQVRITPIRFLNRVQRIVCQQLEAHHQPL